MIKHNDRKTKTGMSKEKAFKKQAKLGVMENEPHSQKVKERFYRKPYSYCKKKGEFVSK